MSTSISGAVAGEGAAIATAIAKIPLRSTRSEGIEREEDLDQILQDQETFYRTMMSNYAHVIYREPIDH